MAQGLHHLHQRGYLHQDVKPGNVLLTADRFAKLADFGLTVAVGGPDAEDEEEEAGQVVAGGVIVGHGVSLYGDAVAVGTARYWPPELWGAESTFCLGVWLRTSVGWLVAVGVGRWLMGPLHVHTHAQSGGTPRAAGTSGGWG